MAAQIPAAAEGRRSGVADSEPIFNLLRHGQTVWNVEGRGQDRLDSPLTTLAIQQARNHRQTLAALPLTHAYTSPMGRALTTARLALEGLDVPLTVLDGLAEVDMGELAGLFPAERLARFPALADARKRDKYRTVLPGGESYESAAPRAARALQRIRADGAGHVLIVCQEMIGRLLRMHLLGLTPNQAMALIRIPFVSCRNRNSADPSTPRPEPVFLLLAPLGLRVFSTPSNRSPYQPSAERNLPNCGRATDGERGRRGVSRL